MRCRGSCGRGANISKRNNPGCCGCCSNTILIWDEDPAYAYGYVGDWTYWFPSATIKNTSGFLSAAAPYDVLATYNIIYIPMPTACSIQSQLAAWLALGHKRLIVTGDGGPAWDNASTGANYVMSAAGSSMRCSTGVFYWCNFGEFLSDRSCLCTAQSGLLVTTGIDYVAQDFSGTVSGGSPVAIGYSDNSDYGGIVGSFVPAAVETITGSEVLLSADVNVFDSPGVPSANYNYKTGFLCNCVTLFP